ncbi:hypothetical protein DMB38_12735 [Streptomyces sp. WAC 06738]|uniref:phage tail protein n=1 Tax=Streptomyces sp. WAC 06738 TaxID=2203210 RepID=UPI000F71CEA6|nr:hypothetical protein [Streptomyces sp. WAC 06738]AZM46564.1 hypothetical protein DMB38_12735 [Streptomyces sp. WAC 06738]
MALTIGELVGVVTVDDTGAIAGIDRTERRMRGLQRGMDSQLRAIAGSLLSVGARIGTLGLALGGAIPVAAGLVATLVEIAPAAAVGTTAMLAMVSAQTAFKIGMQGVGDAVAAAMDPSDPEKYAEALKKLAPNARAFVEQIRSMQPALHRLQQQVQNRLFADLDQDLARTARVTLPALRSALTSSASTLNEMGRGVLTTARGLGRSGVLGKALSSATSGLKNLADIPGQILQGFAQLAAAAGPTFTRLTAALGDKAGDLAGVLTSAFESGSMQRAIEQAVELSGDLFDVLGNVGSIVGSIFGAADTSGAGFLSTLKEITESIDDAFASSAVQSGLQALIGTMATLAETAGPILGTALQVVGRVFAKLGPPAQKLIGALGDALLPVISAAEPVLLEMADAAGEMVTAALPLLPVISQLAVSLLPAVTPLFAALGRIFRDSAPVIKETAQILLASLQPALAALPQIIGPLAQMFAQNLNNSLQIFSQLLVALGPSLIVLGQAFADIMIAAGPLILAFSQVSAEILTALMPALRPLIALVGRVASVLAGRLASQITGVVVPALRALTALLSGDFSTAWRLMRQAVSTSVRQTLALVTAVPRRIIGALAPLGGMLFGAMARAGGRMLSATISRATAVVRYMSRVPGMIVRAVGSLGSLLYGAGQAVVEGLWNGISSMGGWLSSKVGSFASSVIPGPIASALGISSPSKVTAAQGRWIARGLVEGLTGSAKQVRSASQRLADIVRDSLAPGRRRSGALDRISRRNKQLTRLANQEARVEKRLAAAEKKLKDRIRARDQLASQVRGGILQGAAVTAQDTTGGPVTASSIITGLRADAADAQIFARNLAKLRKLGVSKNIIADIAQAGVEGGGAQAAALATANRAQIKQLNGQQKLLQQAAGRAGDVAGNAMYSSGIQAAKGLVRGLRSQDKALERAMLRIAKNLRTGIRKALGIHSPSRVMDRDVGRYIPAGLVRGIQHGQAAVDAAMSSLVSVPSPATAGAAGGGTPAMAGASAGGAVATLRIELAGPSEMRRIIRRIVQVDGRGSIQVAFGNK